MTSTLIQKRAFLRNRHGIRTQEALDRAEVLFVISAIAENTAAPLEEPDSGPDFAYLKRLHKRLFGEMYDWAGEVRDVDISKGATRFANFRFIEAEGERLTAEMADKNWFSGLSHEEFAEQAAYYFGELNTLHPFREGNGRTLREYFRYLAYRVGHTIDWGGLDPEEMVRASIHAHNADHGLLREIPLDDDRPVTEAATPAGCGRVPGSATFRRHRGPQPGLAGRGKVRRYL